MRGIFAPCTRKPRSQPNDLAFLESALGLQAIIDLCVRGISTMCPQRLENENIFCNFAL